MSDEPKGLRALPPALTLAFAVSLVMMIVRLAYYWTVKEPWRAVRFNLVSEGTGLVVEVLALTGTFELARRLTGQAALGARVAAIGYAGTLALDLANGALGFMQDPWRHEWIYKALDYAFFTTWLVVPIGLAIATWRDKRALGLAIVIVSLLTWPPPFLGKLMYGWLPSGTTGSTIRVALGALRIGLLLAGFAAIARGTTVSDRALAARGLRVAGKALWLRVIAPFVVVLLMLMAVGGRSQSGVEVLKLALFVAALVNILALAMFGVGAARAARGAVPDLSRWPTVLGAAASLWATGVTLGQLPYLYKMLYAGGSGFAGRDAQSVAEALPVAVPLVVVTGVTLVGIAISGFAARRGDHELREAAQAKITGFVSLTLVALAITVWMRPKADTFSTVAILMLLAAGAALVGSVMMARLLGRAADVLESEPGLPKASVVIDRT